MDIVLLVSALIKLVLQDNTFSQLAPKVLIKTADFSNAI